MTQQAQLEEANAKYAADFAHGGKPSPPARNVVRSSPPLSVTGHCLCAVRTRAADRTISTAAHG